MIDYNAKIECKASYDVVVAGGGVSGIGAAIEAARQGARLRLSSETAFWAVALPQDTSLHR